MNLPVIERKHNAYLIGLWLLLAFVGLIMLHPGKAAAACAAQDTSRGQVTSSFTVPSDGTYRVWSRIMAPDTTNNSYILEIDSSSATGTCGVVVGDGTAIPASSWTWVDYKNGNTASKIDVVLTAGTHTLTMIGREDNVELDRVIFTTDTTGTDCNPPSGTGDLCANPADTTNPTVSITAPTAGSTVKNTVSIAATAADDVAVGKVEFYVDGTLKATDSAAPYSYSFDTTSVSNGSHNLMAKAYDTSLNSASATIAVTVNNPAVCSASSSTPPTTPTNVVRSSGTYTSITLSWSASSPSPGCTLTGYHVLRGGNVVGTVTGTTYTDTGLTSGTSYNYNVEAYDSGPNTSAQSSLVSFSTSADDVAPTIPASFAASAGSAASVNLTWVASTDNPSPGGVGVASYNIYRNGSTTPTYTVNGAGSVSYSDTNVAASTKYTYVITAVDRVGNESAPSTSVSATTPAPTCSGTPSVPTALHATGQTITTITFAWTASTASAGCTLSGYHVFNGGIYVRDVLSGTSFTDIGLVPNTSYQYTVSAFDTSAHTSAKSTALTAATVPDTTNPSVPGSVTATAASSAKVNLSWTAASDDVGVASYQVYRDGTLLATLPSTALSYSDTTVAASSSYSYQVSATDGAGNQSVKVAATPNPVVTPASIDRTAPTQPTAPRAPVVAAQSANLSWTASTDNVGVVGYHILINGVPDSFDHDTTTNSIVAKCLAPNVTYSFTIIAYDAAGNVSTGAALIVTTQTGGYSGDFDCSLKVDSSDLSTLARNWNHTNVLPTDGDATTVDATGITKVDSADLSALARNWGKPQL